MLEYNNSDPTKETFIETESKDKEIQQAYYDGYEKGFQEGRKSEVAECLKILIQEQEEFAEDRDKNSLNYVIAYFKEEQKKNKWI